MHFESLSSEQIAKHRMHTGVQKDVAAEHNTMITTEIVHFFKNTRDTSRNSGLRELCEILIQILASQQCVWSMLHPPFSSDTK